MSVHCWYPGKDDHTSLPEGFDEWKTADTCTHDWCMDADAAYRASPSLRDPEYDEMVRNDRELVLDEYHGVFR